MVQGQKKALALIALLVFAQEAQYGVLAEVAPAPETELDNRIGLAVHAGAVGGPLGTQVALNKYVGSLAALLAGRTTALNVLKDLQLLGRDAATMARIGVINAAISGLLPQAVSGALDLPNDLANLSSLLNGLVPGGIPNVPGLLAGLQNLLAGGPMGLLQGASGWVEGPTGHLLGSVGRLRTGVGRGQVVATNMECLAQLAAVVHAKLTIMGDTVNVASTAASGATNALINTKADALAAASSTLLMGLTGALGAVGIATQAAAATARLAVAHHVREGEANLRRISTARESLRDNLRSGLQPGEATAATLAVNGLNMRKNLLEAQLRVRHEAARNLMKSIDVTSKSLVPTMGAILKVVEPVVQAVATSERHVIRSQLKRLITSMDKVSSTLAKVPKGPLHAVTIGPLVGSMDFIEMGLRGLYAILSLQDVPQLDLLNPLGSINSIIKPMTDAVSALAGGLPGVGGLANIWGVGFRDGSIVLDDVPVPDEPPVEVTPPVAEAPSPAAPVPRDEEGNPSAMEEPRVMKAENRWP